MSPDSLAQLGQWGLSAAVAVAAGLFDTVSARSLYSEMPAAPAIVIPYFDPVTGSLRQFPRDGGQLPYARLRWLTPRPVRASGFVKPKLQRYVQPRKSGVAAYFPPSRNWAALIRDPATPLVLTEGEAKALASCSYGFPCIGFGGVYSFTDRDGRLLPELDAVTWADREVYICYDSDASVNPKVMAAEARLVEELQRQRGARCKIVRLPELVGGAKQGLDEYLKNHGSEAFKNLCIASPALSALEAKIIALNHSCAWIEREAMIYDFDQRMLIRKDAFVAGSRHSQHVYYAPGAGGQTKAVNVAHAWLRHPYAQRFSEALFRPNMGVTVSTESGQPAINLWQGYQEEPGDVSPWLALTAHVLSNMRAEDRELPIKLLAYKAQHPEQKIPLALVMVGLQGSGKSAWSLCVREAFGQWGQAIGVARLVGQFNGWIEKCLLVEVDEVDALTFTVNAEKIRGLVSQVRVSMEEKFRPLREVNNYAFFIFNSNKRAVASFEVDDRRMIVIDTPGKREPEFYNSVFAWRAAGGPRWLMNWLLNYPLGDWSPPATAPVSEEKAMAHREGLTPVQELAHAMRTAKVPMVETWLDSAAEWARRAEQSPQPHLSQMGSVVVNTLTTLQIKPWYTPQELAMMFPSIVEQTQGARMRTTTPSGQVSRELREAGIPYLRSADDPRGFWHKGQLKQYLVVSDFEEWSKPLAQADFDRHIAAFPTYQQIKAWRRGKK